jgi:type I restriction enzyme S subunit
MTGQRFGLSAATIDKIQGVLERHPVVQRAVIYGSRAKGNYRPGSDIDLTLFAADGQSISYRELGDILDEVDDLLLPYTLDLSAFEQLNHDQLREHIERVGQVFYERRGTADHLGVAVKSGWQTRPLGEVCEFLNRGISPKYLEQGGVCVLNQKCIRDHVVSCEPSRRHDSNAKKVSAERFVRVGDVLVNSTGVGTLGRVAQVRSEPDEPTTVDSHITIVRPKSDMFHLDFFGYMLVVIEDAIREAGEGCGGQTELARAVLADRFDVCYPTSVAEQKRIVAILDEAFEGIATAKANTEKNLQNARAIFESHLNAVFTQRGEGWVEKPLSELCHVKHGFAFDGAFFSNEGEYVLLTPGNFHETGGYRDRGAKQKYFTGEIPLDYVLDEGDLLVAMTEQAAGLLGSPVLVPQSGKFLHNQRLGLVISKPGVPWTNNFFFHVFNLPAVRKAIHDSASGAKVRHTSPRKIGDVVVTFPVSIPEQDRIVENLSQISEDTQRLESIYQRKLSALEALKKSLLHQAFSGEL